MNLGSTINSTLGDSLPSFSADGHWMFFASDAHRRGGFGGPDLYQSYRADIHDDFGWQTPTNLGATSTPRRTRTGTATSTTEATRSCSSAATGWAAAGVADLYMSDLQADGTWGPAR